MLIFLLWRNAGAIRDDLAPHQVAANLQSRFAPLFAEPPPVRVKSAGDTHLAYLDLPIRGWEPACFEASGNGWALAPEYPLDAVAVLRKRATPANDDGVLRDLGQQLEADAPSLLADLAPPFSLIWSKSGDDVRVQNDAMGQAQLFEVERGPLWALTNRVSALPVLGVPLEPDPVEFATRFTLGWFPMDTTGFRGVRYLEPGTALQIDTAGRLSRTRHDVLERWVVPDPMPRDACLELGRTSIREHLRACASQWNKPSVGLSGGWDSRVVVSTLRSLGEDFDVRVRGSQDRFDVMISNELARIAGLRLRIKVKGGFPPDDAAGCRRSISSALLWQAGAMDLRRHTTFLARKPHLDAGVVNVMGQHGGFGKADFVVKIGARELPDDLHEPRLVDTLMDHAPSFLRPDMHEAVRERIITAYRQADRYGLTGLARLHFFFLYEYTRRWGSATLASQPGLVVAPYMSAGFIRACYAYPEREIADRPFHRHIVGTLAPDWADIPYEDQATQKDVASGRIPKLKLKRSKRHFHEQGNDWRRARHRRTYKPNLYWKEVAAPIIEEAFDRNGFWTSVFDAGKARNSWQEDPGRDFPEALAIAHLLPSLLDC